MDATLTINTKSDDQLRHNIDVAGILYKYDLPMENQAISFKSNKALVAADEEAMVTAT